MVVHTEALPTVTRHGTAMEVTETFNSKGTAIWTAHVPEGTKEIVFALSGNWYTIEVYMVEMAQKNREKLQLCSYDVIYIERQKFSVILVRDDGTTQNLNGQVLDGEFIYQNYIQPFAECAEEYLAYHEMLMSTLKSHNIGWMDNCQRNIFAPKDLMWFNGENDSIPFAHFSRWEDGLYWANEDVQDLLKEYE